MNAEQVRSSPAALAAEATRPDRRGPLGPARPPRAAAQAPADSNSASRRVESSFCPGDRLPGTPYVVVGPLGHGGMGEVVLVEHAELQRRFAVKMLHRRFVGRRDLEARMRDEARALAALRHPNLVEVFDLGTTADGRLYFAMDALDGRDLRKELTRFSVLAVPAALGLVAQALDGLAAAHNARVIHRDIKLENLFLCDDGVVKILDFGIAKVSRASADPTGDGPAAGTIRCMAPEQHASGPIDHRADLYSMGLVLYELVAGRGPFDEHRGNVDALRYAHCERPPPRPSELAPQLVPLAVDDVIARSIAKSPADRFQTAAEMADALRRVRAALLAPAAENASALRAASAPAPARLTGYESTGLDRRPPKRPSPPPTRTKTRPYLWGQSPAVAALTTLMVVATTIGAAVTELVPRRF